MTEIFSFWFLLILFLLLLLWKTRSLGDFVAQILKIEGLFHIWKWEQIKIIYEREKCIVLNDLLNNHASSNINITILHSSITRLTMEVIIFELKLSKFSISQTNQLIGSTMDDLNYIFLFSYIIVVPLKWIILITISIRDIGHNMLRYLHVNSITTWKQLSNAFLAN